MPTLRERFVKRLASHGVTIPDIAEIRRTRAGHWMKAHGAWSAYFAWEDSFGFHDFGWYKPIRVLMKCQNWELAQKSSEVDCGCIGQCKYTALTTPSPTPEQE